jgi:hypothetical protein
MARRYAPKPLSDKQKAALMKMRTYAVVPEGMVIPGWDALMAGEPMTREVVDAMFDLLGMLLPPTVEPGTYVHDGELYRVQTSKRSGRNYALHRVGTSWEYESWTDVYDLKAEEKTTEVPA